MLRRFVDIRKLDDRVDVMMRAEAQITYLPHIDVVVPLIIMIVSRERP